MKCPVSWAPSCWASAFFFSLGTDFTEVPCKGGTEAEQGGLHAGAVAQPWSRLLTPTLWHPSETHLEKDLCEAVLGNELLSAALLHHVIKSKKENQGSNSHQEEKAHECQSLLDWTLTS